jgi:DnaJ-class molecular chaperone
LKLAEAYETLKDENTRRLYDLAYPSIKKENNYAQNTGTPRSTDTSNQKTDCFNEAEQIAVLQRSKEQRSARWRTMKNTFDSTIFDLQREIRRLEQDVRNLEDISAAERDRDRDREEISILICI